MKLLTVIPYFPPHIGGTENYAYNICKGLKDEYDWKIVVVTSNHGEKNYVEEKINGIKIYRLAPLFRISNTPINPFWYFQVKRIIEKEKPNIINAHTPVPFIADIAARTCGKIPFVLTYHGDLTKENLILNLFCKLYYFIIGNNTLTKADKIIATSKYYAKNSPYLNTYINEIGIVPPGVDTHNFNLKVNKGYLKKKYGNHHYVLFVGQLDKTHIHKGINYLLDAILLIKKKIKDIKLIVVGKGDNIKNYKKYVQKISLEKNVIFTGFVSSNKLPEYYTGSNVTVLPTNNSSEGFGMVLLEANACGKPIVGTNVGGIPCVIDNYINGLLVPPKNPQALADAITKILTNPSLAKKMGEKGYKKVIKNFTWEKQINKTRELIEKEFFK
ncbi:MAG: glycosyltransferase family 4 protein [Bacteroidota bacterium]|jgi:glycosyltransferase involved in cell wall biosynthesis